MLDAAGLANFHFLRPLWLLGIVCGLLIYWLRRRQARAFRGWGDIIAPHLLRHLIVGSSKGARITPIDLLLAFTILGSLAMAGPTWQREPSPFTEDVAPLVIAIDLSQSMDVEDIQPSRLERAKQKVRDLLEDRKGARTALLAYAGTAHMVLPLTEDPNIMKTYVSSLGTAMMPVEGKNPAEALHLAEAMMAGESAPGTILFITDGIGEENASVFIEHRETSRNQVAVLGVGTTKGGPVPIGRNRYKTGSDGKRLVSRLDREGLEALAGKAGAYVTSVTVDESDIRRIHRRIQSHLVAAQNEDENQRWKDFGCWLVYPIAILALFWFRRGWLIQWGTAVLLLTFFPLSRDAVASEFRFIDLWLTPDQQGRYYFEKGEYAKAAERFQDPLWKGLAYYANEDFEEAIPQFARVDTAEGNFNLGNAYAQNGNYKNAIESYERALEMNPGYEDAEFNRNFVRELLQKEEDLMEQKKQGMGADLGADEIQISDEKDSGDWEGAKEELTFEGQQFMDEALQEMWMRQVQTTPADFLRIKFAYQAMEEKQAEPSEGDPQ